MDPEIRNFDTIEDFIQNHPKTAQNLVSQWERFVENNPEFRGVEDVKQWYQLIQGKNIDPGLFVGKEVRDAYAFVRQDLQQSAPDPSLNPPVSPLDALSLATPLLLLIKEQPELMEDDKAYKKIAESKKKDWLKNNPGKDFSSKEGLDYLYGSLGEKGSSSLAKDTEKAFRDKNPHTAKKYDEKKKKLYKNFKEDPAFLRTNQRTEEHANAHYDLFAKENPNLSEEELAEKKEEILKKVSDKELDAFAEQYTDKAVAYDKQDPKIAAAVHRKYVREQLSQYQSATGKEIKYVEKTHAPAPAISQEEIASRLQGLSTQMQTRSQEESSGLADIYGRPLPSALNSVPTGPQQAAFNPNQPTKQNAFWQQHAMGLKIKRPEPRQPQTLPGQLQNQLARGGRIANAISNPRAAVANYAAQKLREKYLKQTEKKIEEFLARQLLGFSRFLVPAFIPVLIVAILAITFFFTISLFLTGAGPTTGSTTPTPTPSQGIDRTCPIPGLCLTVTSWPPNGGIVAVGEEINYFVVPEWDASAAGVSIDKIDIFDTIPKPNTQLEHVTGSAICEPSSLSNCTPNSTKTTWRLTDNFFGFGITLKAISPGVVNNRFEVKIN